MNDLFTPAANMNAAQQTVIDHVHGPLQVLAVAGCGKTRALVHRIERLVKVEGVEPKRIFAVTFSRLAAKEMEDRLKALGVEASVQTWHAFANRVLKEDHTKWSTWKLDDKDREKTLLKDAIGYKNLNWTGADVTKIRSFIGYCKANLFEPNSPEAAKLASARFSGKGHLALKAFALLNDLLETNGLLTFDDMLVFACRWLEDEDNRRSWAEKFDFVLQDEAQDANIAQSTIARALAKDHRNYMIVGDPAQAIYGFRGSSPEHIMSFEEEWDAKRVAMAQNYRSQKPIVDFANSVIAPAAIRLPEEMIASRRDADPKASAVRISAALNFDDEANQVIDHAKKLQAGGSKLKDLTVLFRLNAQSRALEEACLRERIPYLLIGGTNFYERKEVKDILGYLRVAANAGDVRDAVRRSINAPFRFLGTKFVERVMDLAPEEEEGSETDWTEIVRRAAQQAGIQRRQVSSAEEWSRMVESLRSKMAPKEITETQTIPGLAPGVLLEWVVSETRYFDFLRKEEGEESIENSGVANIRELIRVAKAYDDVSEFLEFVDQNLRDSKKQSRVRADRVTLMSIHRSKGLEWPHVWVVGVNENVLPHAKGDPEEERRLMYVAATRARDTLVCSHVTNFGSGDGGSEPSRFIVPFMASARAPQLVETVDQVEDV